MKSRKEKARRLEERRAKDRARVAAHARRFSPGPDPDELVDRTREERLFGETPYAFEDPDAPDPIDRFED